MNLNCRFLWPATVAIGLLFSTQAALAEHEHHQDQNHQHNHHMPVAMVEPVSEHSLHQLSALWQDHHQQPLVLKELAGEAVIVTMIYASCQTACPVLVADVKRLYQSLTDAEQADTRVLVVSFDAERDTPAALNAFAQSLGGDHPGWHFVTGDKNDIRTMAALLGIRYRENPNGGFDHSNVIAVLDRQGEILGRQEGLMQSLERLMGALRSALN